MSYLIDDQMQQIIANRIDTAVAEVLQEMPNHGSEEGLTPVLGHALRRQSVRAQGLEVRFNYRQLNKQTEEPAAGADGGFLVSVRNADTTVHKVALFQAKLLKGSSAVRQLRMRDSDVLRLRAQVSAMLQQTKESVAIFYTHKQIYVVDAADYESSQGRIPLSQSHRLITLGTYLGRWLPRCTKGDQSPDLFTRVKHLDGFKQGLSMDVISQRPSIASSRDPEEVVWRPRPIARR